MMQLMNIQWTRPSFLPAGATFLGRARAVVQLLLQYAIINQFVTVYPNNFLVYSESKERYLVYFMKVFGIRESQICLNMKKCEF